MLERYQELCDFISKLKEVENNELMRSRTNKVRIKRFISKLYMLQSVACKMQENNISMEYVSGLLPCVVD